MMIPQLLNIVGFCLTCVGGWTAIRSDQLSDQQIHDATHPLWSPDADHGEGALRRKRANGRWGFGIAALGAALQLAGGMMP